MKVFAVVGWKNTGKTGLTERLIAAFTDQGMRVSSLKHTHHSVDLDQPGKDSHRHREAGAQEVMLVSGTRMALLQEFREHPEPRLEALLARLTPVDLVILEGFKSADVPKLEAHRVEAGKSLLASTDPRIFAVASNGAPEVACPVLDLDDTAAIVAQIQATLDL